MSIYLCLFKFNSKYYLSVHFFLFLFVWFFVFVFVFVFLLFRLNLQHMEFLRLGDRPELQLPA